MRANYDDTRAITEQSVQTLDFDWVALALSAAFVLSFLGGIKLFQRRVLS